MEPPFHWDHIGEGSYLRFNYRGIGHVRPDGNGAWEYAVRWQGSEHTGVTAKRGRAIAWMERWVCARTGLPAIPDRRSSRR